MPRMTRATRAAVDRLAEEQSSDTCSDDDCDSAVESRARAGAAPTHTRDSNNTAEAMRAQGGAALDHTFTGTHAGAPAAMFTGAHTGAPAATFRGARTEVPAKTDEAEKTRVQAGAASDHTLSGAHTGAPAVTLSTERFLSTMMESFARMQAESNRTIVETLRTLHGDQRNPVTPTPVASPAANAARATSGGNFSKCTARFDGQSRDPEVLEAFIDAVEVYKECADVTDEHALRGLSMLLTGDAALWWRGARACAGTWPDALARLRATYGVQKPAYRILREIFACEHECERAEMFINKVRSLLVQLPYVVPSVMIVDIVYGLLHRRIRKRLSRDNISDIDDLLEKARLAEDSIMELKNSSIVPEKNPNIPTARDRGTTSPSATPGSKLTSNSNENSKRNRVRCSFCKAFGHTSNECRRSIKVDGVNRPNKVDNDSKGTNPIRCYGCGQLGVVKSKCENCCKTPGPAKSSDFNVVLGNYFATMTSLPLVTVGILGKEGVALIDTGATHSVASPLLYSLLVDKGVQFIETERCIGLADGSRHSKMVKIATVPVTLGSRRINTEFMVFPGDDTRTLLGRNFIANAGMVLDIAQESWHFADSPGDRLPFVQSYVLNSAAVTQADVCDVSLRQDEGTSLSSEHRAALNKFLRDRVAQFASAGPPTDFAVHKIKVSETQEPLASPPYRLSPPKREALEKELHELVNSDVIEECESPWASNRIIVDPGKTAAIADMATPRNVRHLKCFLQTSSWFRRFVPDYAEVAKPLTTLLKKTSVWQWGPEQQAAFERIKHLLVSAPILRQADATLPFVLRTDSSGYALGAVLLQGEGTDERPIEYASRLLTAAEKNYSTTEREALAVVWAVSKFRGYIDGAEVTIKSDHQPLRWLMSMKSPSGRLARWALSLQEYNLKIEYTPGKANVVADTLSRPACAEDTECDLCCAAADMPSRSLKDLRENQMRDPEVSKIVEALESDDPSRGRVWADKGYVLAEGVLYRYCPENEEQDDASQVVPEHERSKVLAEYHDAPTAGHMGAERTLQRLVGKYYWPGMRSYVTQYVKNCVPCQRYKADTRKPAGLLQTPAPTRRFEVLAVDLFGPLPETAKGHKWILIVEDTCTRWVELFALASATSEECAKVLVSEVYLRFGVPRRLVSDNGVQFISDVMQQTCHAMGITQSLTSYYHPEANPVERKNRDLKPQLAILVGRDHDTWDIHLPAVRFAMNSAVTSGTGYTPAYLNFARNMRAPADVMSEMRTIIENDNYVGDITTFLKRISLVLLDARDVYESAQAAHKKYADDHRRPAPDYKVGDLVLLKTQGANDTGRGQTAKLIPRRDGPYKIQAVISPTTYILERLSDGTVLGKYHVSVLTPFVGRIQAPVQEKRKRGRPRRS